MAGADSVIFLRMLILFLSFPLNCLCFRGGFLRRQREVEMEESQEGQCHCSQDRSGIYMSSKGAQRSPVTSARANPFVGNCSPLIPSLLPPWWLTCPLHSEALVSEPRDRIFQVHGYDRFQALDLVMTINFLQLHNWMEFIYWLYQGSNSIQLYFY